VTAAALPTGAGVYVIHLSKPLAHARGYTGWAANIARRIEQHLDVEACRRAGAHLASHRGSPLVCAAVRAGRSAQVVRVYPGGDRGLEWRLHNRHHPRICPVCSAQRTADAGQQLRLIRVESGAAHAAAPTPRRAAA
jgi:hypothetical protein